MDVRTSEGIKSAAGLKVSETKAPKYLKKKSKKPKEYLEFS